MNYKNYISAGFDDNGDADFEIPLDVTKLSHEQLQRLRAMIVVAIGTMEDMWRRANQEKAKLNTERNVQASVATGDDSKENDDKQK